MNSFDGEYLDLVLDIRYGGTPKEDRTGVGTLSSFGHQKRYNLLNGFPLLQCKATHFKSIVVELLWFLRGDTNTAYLKQHGVSIWNEWCRNQSNLNDLSRKKVILIDKITYPYSDYFSPNHSTSFERKSGSVDDKLYGTWNKMMDR